MKMLCSLCKRKMSLRTYRHNQQSNMGSIEIFHSKIDQKLFVKTMLHWKSSLINTFYESNPRVGFGTSFKFPVQIHIYITTYFL